MIINEDDKEWLKQYPFTNKLKLTENDNGYAIDGIFSFSAIFDQKRRGYILNPSNDLKTEENYIEDEYTISILIPKKDYYESNFYKNVKETNGRIKATAAKFELSPKDLHLNNNETETLCIIGLFQEDCSIGLQNFLKGAILQFFYDQSFCQRSLCKTGKRNWPRGEYSHGLKGMLESYFDCYQEASMERKFEITMKMSLEIKKTMIMLKNKKISDVDEYVIFEGIRRVFNNQNYPELLMYSKYMQAILTLKKATKYFNLMPSI